MSVIQLHPTRFIQVKNKEKTATLRDGVRDYKLGSASLVNSENNRDCVQIEITTLKLIKLKDLDSNMLKRQGYASLDEARKTIKSVYPEFTEDSILTHIEFDVKKIG